MDTPLLQVKDLSVSFRTERGLITPVHGVSYCVSKGEIMGIVGESGCGKSVSAYSVLGLLKGGGRVTGGEILFDGEDILALSKAELTAFRGSQVSMIFQNPLSCLNPVYTIGRQLTEAYLAHREHADRAEAKARAIEMLERVGITDAPRRMRQYPFELSGGMRQRVMIAIALMCQPRLLIADEPTTALDVTIQAQILRLLRQFRDETGMAIVFITHNMGVISEICDRVSVMYAGTVVEQGAVDEVFYQAAHPYTTGLLNAIPRVDAGSYKRLIPIEGTPVELYAPPDGCPFHPRCPRCMDRCRREAPPERELSPGHTVRCWLQEEGQHD